MAGRHGQQESWSLSCSRLILSDLMLSDLMLSCQMLSCLMLSCLMSLHPVLPSHCVLTLVTGVVAHRLVPWLEPGAGLRGSAQ